MSVSLRLDNIVVSIQQLMLDPNNYRLAYGSKATTYADSEVCSIQEDIERQLAKEKLTDLRDSIIENGFLEVDRIVVRKLDGHENEKYLVVEGNRRTAALKSLLEDHHDGFLVLDDTLLKKLNSINVVLINSSNPDEIRNYANTLMGIRHVSGPKKWTGMQSAKLICNLFDQKKTPTQIGSLLGISAIEANRRRRGFLAYSQLAIDPTYGSNIQNKHYTLLLEFVSKKSIRNLLDWTDKKQINNTIYRQIIYSHIVKGVDGSKPQITNPTQAREFVKALGIPRFEAKIVSGVTYKDLGPISENTEDIDSELKRIRAFFNKLDKDLLSQTNYSTMKSIKAEIELLLSEAE